MQLHQIKRQSPRHRQKLVGRGGKRGTTAGRGTKGQRARAGHRIRPAIRDVIKRLPKRRGYQFTSPPGGITAVPLNRLIRHFSAGETISPPSLVAKRFISAAALRRGLVKIIGPASAPLPRTLTVQDCLITPAARQAVEQAGGKVIARAVLSPHVK